MSARQNEGPLASYIADWHPEPSELTAVIERSTATLLAEFLDVKPPEDGQLPTLWQWGYFREWPGVSGLNEDGHSATDPFQPPIPGRRRMWAGGSVTALRPLRIGRVATRRGSIRSAVPKSGRSGEMILVTAQYDYLQNDEVCIQEVQNHVYRTASSSAGTLDWGSRPADLPVSEAPWQHAIVSDPVRLFRMSALTANSHRIHYDRPYAQDVEGYPDLVVHGPLLAMHLGILANRFEPSWVLRQFDYRVQAPVFVAEPVLVEGQPPADLGTSTELRVVSATGTTHVSATASYGGAA